MSRWKYFDLSEFDCPCCGKNNIKYALVDILDRVRHRIGQPMTVNSGCRCENHNAEVGGADDSEHLDGYAADIDAKSSRMKFLLIKYGIEEGITRFGIGDTFVHMGISPDKASKVIWVY